MIIKKHDAPGAAGRLSALPAIPLGDLWLGTLATTHHSCLGSFSAGSTATIATKYSFFQVFRDLQNYLAKFSKILEILQKINDFRKKQHFFSKNPEISQNFTKFCYFFAKFSNFF